MSIHEIAFDLMPDARRVAPISVSVYCLRLVLAFGVSVYCLCLVLAFGVSLAFIACV